MIYSPNQRLNVYNAEDRRAENEKEESKRKEQIIVMKNCQIHQH